MATALTGLSTTGANVFVSRVYPLQTAELPGLLVYADSETSAPSTIGFHQTVERTVQVKVEAMVKSTVDWDDALDAICAEVEVALANPVDELDGIAKSVTLTDTTIEMVGTAEKPVGSARMTFAVLYYADEATPDVAS